MLFSKRKILSDAFCLAFDIVFLCLVFTWGTQNHQKPCFWYLKTQVPYLLHVFGFGVLLRVGSLVPVFGV